MSEDNTAPLPLDDTQQFLLKQLEIKHRALKEEFSTTVGVKRYYARMHEAVLQCKDDESLAAQIDAVMGDVIIAAARQRALDKRSPVYDLLYGRLELALKRLCELVEALEAVALIPYHEAFDEYFQGKKDA